MAISAAQVKELRDRTNAGMMDCKKALAETNGDMEAAVDWLRTKGLAAAAKKSGRTAAEGLVGVAVEGTKGAVIEVNSETDFVAKNDTFQAFVKDVADLSLKADGDIEKLKAMNYPGADGTVADRLTDNIAKIGENQSLRRTSTLSVDQGAIVSYVHNAAAPNLGKIGVLVALESAADQAQLQTLGKQIAMHIAAANPLALTADDLDPDMLDREREIAKAKAMESGKPENIAEKMVEGSIKKFAKENALLSQLFVMDNKTPIADVVGAAGKEAGSEIKLVAFERFQLGEGIEKEEDDFAAEVAKAAGTDKKAD